VFRFYKMFAEGSFCSNRKHLLSILFKFPLNVKA